MSKKERSELQKAADRVREAQVAVDNMEANKQVCLEEYHQCKLAYEESTRNLNDTTDLLLAQKNKLEREISSVRSIVGFGPIFSAVDTEQERIY